MIRRAASSNNQNRRSAKAGPSPNISGLSQPSPNTSRLTLATSTTSTQGGQNASSSSSTASPSSPTVSPSLTSITIHGHQSTRNHHPGTLPANESGSMMLGEHPSSSIWHQWLNPYFKLDQRDTTVQQELSAGFSGFLLSCYILLLTPVIMSFIGLPFHYALITTGCSAALATLCIGVFSNLPLILAPGLCLSTYIVFSLAPNYIIRARQANGADYTTLGDLHGPLFLCQAIASLIGFLMACFNLSEWSTKLISPSIKTAVIAGTGIAISIVGICLTGAFQDVPLPRFIHISLATPHFYILIVSLALTAILLRHSVPPSEKRSQHHQHHFGTGTMQSHEPLPTFSGDTSSPPLRTRSTSDTLSLNVPDLPSATRSSSTPLSSSATRSSSTHKDETSSTNTVVTALWLPLALVLVSLALGLGIYLSTFFFDTHSITPLSPTSTSLLDYLGRIPLFNLDLLGVLDTVSFRHLLIILGIYFVSVVDISGVTHGITKLVLPQRRRSDSHSYTDPTFGTSSPQIQSASSTSPTITATLANPSSTPLASNLHHVYMYCSAFTFLSALFCSPPVLLFVESAVVINRRARTGLASVTAGLLFGFTTILLYFIIPTSPIVSYTPLAPGLLAPTLPVPPAALTPVMLLVSSAMLTHIQHAPLANPATALPVVVTLSIIILTFDIFVGLVAGATLSLLVWAESQLHSSSSESPSQDHQGRSEDSSSVSRYGSLAPITKSRLHDTEQTSQKASTDEPTSLPEPGGDTVVAAHDVDTQYGSLTDIEHGQPTRDTSGNHSSNEATSATEKQSSTNATELTPLIGRNLPW